MEVLELFLKTDWTPRSGPVTLIQQITVGLYLLTVVLCLLASWLSWRNRSYTRFDIGFWLGFGVAFLALTFNRSFHVQGGVTQFLRGIAYHGYWYGTRRNVQEPIVITVVLLGVLFFILLRWLVRPVWQNYKLAAFGLAFLSIIIMLRTISFHNTDRILYDSVFGLHVHQIWEMFGIGVVSTAAILYLARIRVTRTTIPLRHPK